MMMACKAAPRFNLNYSAAPKMARKMAAPKKMHMDMDMDMSKAAPTSAFPKKEFKMQVDNNINNNMDDLTKLIMSQDIIEGAWNENNETKKLINIITQNKFDLINNKVKGLNKGEQERKILFALLVIYYLMIKQSDKLNDYRLVINKAKKFLMNQGIKYEDFIVGI